MATEFDSTTSLTASNTDSPDLPIFDSKNVMINNQAELKAQTASSVVVNKSQAVERARIKKLYLNGSLPPVDEFQFAFPDATPERISQYEQELVQGRQAAWDKQANRDRSFDEVVGDTDTALGIGVARLGQLADTVVNLPATLASSAVPGLVESPGETEFGTFLKDRIGELNQRKSAPLRYSEQQQSKQLSEFKNEAEERQATYNDRYGDSKIGSFFAAIEEGGREFGLGAKTLITDPRLLLSTAVENAPQLLAGSVISATSKTLAASKSVKELVANPAFSDRIDELGISANIIFNALAEGNDAATQIRETVLSTPIATLRAENPDFDERVSKLGSEEAAKASIANDAFILGLGTQAAAATITGKVTGSAKADSRILDVNPKPSSVTGALAKEATEEAINEGTGQATQNLAEQKYVDSTKSIGEDVAFSAGVGVVAGPATQALTQASISVFKPVIDPTEAAKLAKAARTKATEVKTNVNNFKAAEKILKEGGSVPENTTAEVAIEVYADNLSDKETGLGKKLDTLVRSSEALDSLKASGSLKPEQVKSYENQIKVAEAGFKKEISSRTLTDVEVFEIAKINPNLLDESKRKQLKESKTLSSTDKDLLGNQQELVDIQSKLDKVQSDIFNGSPEYKGIATYIAELKSAVASKNDAKSTAAIEGLDNLKVLQEAKLVDLKRIYELASNESLTTEETAELTKLKDTRDISFTGKGIQSKWIPAVEVEIEALTSAIRVAEGIKASGINTDIITTLDTSGIPDAEPVSSQSDAGVIKDTFNTLSPRAKARLEESLPNTYKALSTLDVGRSLTSTQYTKLNQALAAAQASTDVTALKKAVKSSTNAKELLDNVRNFGDKKQRAVADRILNHPLLDGVTVSIEPTKDGYYGSYSKSQRKITIDSAFLTKADDSKFDRLMETLIHEAIHPVTVDILDEDRAKAANLTKQREQFVSRINTLNRAVSKYIELNKERLVRENPNAISAFTYAVNNIEEFPTKVLTDASLQSLLKEVVINKKSVFTRLAEAMANLFGLSKDETTALQEAISISDDIIATTEVTPEYSLSSHLKTNTVNDGEFAKRFTVKLDGTLATTPNAISALENSEVLKEFQNEFKQVLTTKVIGPTDPKYRDVRMFHYLLNASSETDSQSEIIDDNIVTAMAVASLDWLQSKGLGTVVNTEEDINRILGRTTDAIVSLDEFRKYAYVGSPTTLIADDIGTNFASLLGLSLNPDAHPDDMDKFKTSLGLMALETMDRMGILSQAEVRLQANDGSNKTNGIRFARVANSFNTVLPEIRQAAEIILNEKEAVKVLAGENVKVKEALLAPVKKVPKTTNRGDSALPEDVREGLRKQMDQPWELKKDTVDAFYSLTPEAQLSIAGYINPRDVHVDSREGVEAKNSSIQRSIDEMTRMLLDLDMNGEKGQDSPFYFDYAVWVQGRIGMVSNWINPQANKLHRALVGMEAHKTLVDPSNLPQMNKYWIAVGNAFGIDKGTKEEIVTKTKAFTELSTTQSAIKAVQALVANLTIDSTNEKFITDVVKGSPHAFEGLVALATKSEDTPFETKIAKEIDGITNGPVIGLTQFMFGSTDNTVELLKKGGIFSDGITTNYAKALGEDLFEDLYVSLVTAWRHNVNSLPNAITSAMDSLGLPFGRNEGKDPLVKTIYGAGITTLAEEFADNRLGILIDMAIKIDSRSDKTGKLIPLAERQKSLDVINDTLEGAFGFNLINFRSGGVINQSIPDSKRDTFRAAVGAAYKRSLEAALEESIPDVIQGNTLSIVASDLTFRMYRGMYEVEKGKLEAKGEWTKKNKQTLLAELDNYAPGIKAFYSIDRKEGILLKSSQRVAPSMDVRVEGNFKTPNSMGVKSYKTTPSGIRDMVNPGVSPASMFVQGIDASTMINTYRQKPTFGVHDAIIVGLNEEETSSEIINEGFYNIAKGYSITTEVIESLDQTVAKVKTYEPKDIVVIREQLKGFKGYKKFNVKSINELIAKFKDLEKLNTANRKQVLEGVTYVNQYENEDGGYAVEGESVQETKKINTLISEIVTKLNGDTDTLANPNLNEEQFLVNQDTIEGVFDGLSSRNAVQEDTEHKEYLREVITGLAAKVIEPLNVHVQDTFSESVSYSVGNNVYIQTASASMPPVGLKRSAEEHFVYEMVFNTIHEGMHGNNLAKREIFKLFQEAKNSSEITPEVFMSNPGLGKNSPEYATAERIYNSVFANVSSESTTTVDPITGLKSTVTRNEYLANFASVALSNKRFKEALSKVTSTKAPSGNETLLEKISTWFSQLMNTLLNRFTGATGKSDERILVLAKRLAGIERKQGGTLGTILDGSEIVQRRAAESISNYVIKPLTDLMRHNALLKSKSYALRTLGLVAHTAPVVTYTDFAKVMRRLRKRSRLMRQGFAAEFITELKGTTDNNKVFHDLLRVKNKVIDQSRIQTTHNYAKFIRDSFNTEMTPERKEALYKVLLKTDMQSIKDAYSSVELVDLLTNVNYLESEIKKLRGSLTKYGSAYTFYVKATTDLGNFMANGFFKEAFAGMNAHVIANMYNTGIETTWDVAEAEAVIDKLATLEAIRQTDRKQLEIASGVLTEEFSADLDNNGVTATLGMLEGFKQEAESLVFNGQKPLMIKGYVKEIYNPNVTITTGNKSEAANLKTLGYRPEFALKRDRDDPVKDTLVLYKSTAGLLGRYDAGVVSTTSKGTKGADIGEIMYQTGTPVSASDLQIENQIVFDKKLKRIQDMMKPGISLSNEPVMVPTLNGNGDVAGYRYIMNDNNRQELLERSHDFDEVIGHMFASTMDKVNSVEINRKVVEAMKVDFDKNYLEEPNNFVRVASDSTDPRLKEIYRMLPKDMQNDVLQVWGNEEFYVKHEHVNLLFGRRKPSVANLELMPLSDKRGVDKIGAMTNNVMTLLLNNKTVKGAEDLWKETVSLAKDAIVVKTGVVTLGNITSNLVTLKMFGVPMADIVSGHADAYKGVLEFIRDGRDLSQLELKKRYMSAGASTRRVDADIAIVKDRMSSNPVKELVDLGIFQNIIEDIDLENDKYTYRSALKDLADPITKMVPDGLLKSGATTALKNVFLTHDTAMYKFLRDSAQISDFAARYVLHKYNQEQGMTSEDSLRDIIETFVNYDLPTHKSIQYGNEMGLLMFTKFSIRTQKVILKLLRKKPENVVMSLLLQSALGDVSDIIGDTNVFAIDYGYKVNPIPFDLLDAIIDIPTIELLQDIAPD